MSGTAFKGIGAPEGHYTVSETGIEVSYQALSTSYSPRFDTIAVGSFVVDVQKNKVGPCRCVRWRS